MGLSANFREQNAKSGRRASSGPVVVPEGMTEVTVLPDNWEADIDVFEVEDGAPPRLEKRGEDGLQTAAIVEFDSEQVEYAVLKDCQDAYSAAIELSQEYKERWQVYRDMAQNKPPLDDPNDPLIALGYWVGILARLRDVMNAQLMGAILPDPSEYDNFEIVPKRQWNHLNFFGEAMTNILRDKFKQMAPKTANGFVDVLNDLLIDWDTTGNCFNVVVHEVLNDFDVSDNGDGLIEGPEVRYVDCMNVWPERLDVSSITDTGVIIYEPVTPDEFYRMDFKNVDKVVDEGTPLTIRNIDENAYLLRRNTNFNEQDKVEQNTMEGWKRYVRFVKFPYYKIRQALRVKDSDYTTEQIDQINQVIVGALAEKFEFDPMAVGPDTWWDIEWIDETLVQCRPYPLALPVGKGPLQHFKMFSRPGWLWGDGLWDRCQVDERFYNMLRRAVIKIVLFTSDPAYEFNENLYDPEWLEIWGDQPRLQPGMILKRLGGTGKDELGFKPVEINEKSLPYIREEIGALYGEMRLQTGVTEQLEGTATDTLATVNANNMQQSMTVMNWHIKRIEHGLMKEIIARMYVVTWQAMQILGMPQTVSVSDQETGVATLEIKPSDILGLSLVDIRMTGSTSPANKQAQVMNMEKFVQTFLPVGILNIPEVAKAYLNMLGISGGDSLLVQSDPNAMMGAIGQVTNAFGPSGVSMLSPMYKQMLGLDQNAMSPQQPGMAMGGPQQGQPGQPPMAQTAPQPRNAA